MDVLKVLLVCYAVLLALSSVVSFKLYLLYRTKPFLLLMLVWPFTLINFALQGRFVDSHAGSITSFSTYFITALCLSKLICVITDIPFCWKRYSIIFCVAGLISFIVYALGGSFVYTSLPLAIAIAAPQIHTSIIKLFQYRHRGPELSNTFAFTLLLNGIHFLDFPFIRPYPEAAVYGFGFVMIITILFSLLLPVIISKHNTDELNKRLIDEMEQTRKLAQVKSDFLANMSHEIRTPINGIRGINDLLLLSELSAEQRHYCEIARQSVNHLTNLISDILSLSQLESGKVNLHNELVEIDELCTELADHYSVRSDVGQLSISFIAHFHPPQSIVIDRSKVIQILYNLVNNAIKYTTGTEIKVSFDLTVPRAVNDGLELVITIFDNGGGIAPEAQESIFSEFNQLIPGKGGVGLGLPIVSRLVKALEGTINLCSSKESGTTFVCKIPTSTIQNKSSGAYQAKTTTCTGFEHFPTSEAGVFKVLAVEDDPTSQMILEAVFKKEGIDGTVVGSAEEALKEYKQSKFNMVFTDVNLPGASGLELVKALRILTPCIPIIIQSAFAFEEDTTKAKNVGATDYLRKPITYQDIVGACERYGAHTKSNSSGAGAA